MKSSHTLTALLWAFSAITSSVYSVETPSVGPSPAASPLEQGFSNPPSSARPWCYWYWMKGNISREGIVADLDGFAKVGIGGLFLLNIGGDGPLGTVNYGTPQWWELFSFAVAEAAKRDIKVSFHCPGWSASGGPWITPDRAMQEVVWSETVVEGGKPYQAVLPQPPSRLDYYREIAVIAFPQLPDDEPLPSPKYVAPDGKELRLGSGNSGFPPEFDIVYPRPVTVRSLFIRTGQWSNFDATLSYWNEAEGAFKTVTRCRHTPTGPFSEKIGAAAFDAVKADKFRITFNKTQNPALVALELSGGSRISKWPRKAGYANCSGGIDVAIDKLEAGETREAQGSVIARDSIIDLSGKTDPAGRLDWTPPPGRWSVLRFGYTPTGISVFPPPPGGSGLECDKLSVETANYHYDQCVTPVLKQLGPDLVKSSLMYYHVDSYEASWQTWTRDFRRNFTDLRGYDLLSFLPCLTGRAVGDTAQSERFLWDFRATISDLFATAHYQQLARRCADDGIRFSTEPYVGPFRALQIGDTADHPMVEFWADTNPRQPGLMTPYKAGIFSGHVNERTIIGAEAFTSEDGWDQHPYSIKALGDWNYCAGVNRFVLHVSAHQSLIGEHLKPGLTCGGNGTHFDRNNTWWEQGAPEFIKGYLSRCQFLLQQGEPLADVLYFQGDESPSHYGPFEPKLPVGYHFDACTIEVLARMKVVDGNLVLPKGKSYRYLVLPANRRMTLASLQVISELAKQGARIVGAEPEGSPSEGDAAKAGDFAALAQDLGGRVLARSSFEPVLARDGLAPDFAYNGNSGMILHATHRRVGDLDLYFVANASAIAGVADCRFRVAGKSVELWHPDTGRIEPCALYEDEGGITRVPLSFDPSGSLFVVFRPGASKVHATQVSKVENTFPEILTRSDAKLFLQSSQGGDYTVALSDNSKATVSLPPVPAPVEISGPWTVTFPQGWGAPEKATFDKLLSWPDHRDEGIKYFSGTAAYSCEFSVKEVAPIVHLDLGRVEVIARVTLNGHPLGVLWKPPFVFDVSGKLRNGVNELKVEITNLWPNRLIGDENYPDDCTPDGSWVKMHLPAWPEWLKKGESRPEKRRLTLTTYKHWKQGDPLLPSGLLGPVRLVTYGGAVIGTKQPFEKSIK